MTTALKDTGKCFLKIRSLYGHMLPFPLLFIASSVVRSQPYFNLIGSKASERLLIRIQNLLLYFHICFCHSVYRCVLLSISAWSLQQPAYLQSLSQRTQPEAKTVAIQKFNTLLATIQCTYLLSIFDTQLTIHLCVTISY